MDQHAIAKYLEQLAVIKQRGKIFQKFSKETTDEIGEEATVEIATLQLRVILEILAFGFVLTIGEKAIPAYASFANYKNLEEFFFQLSKFDQDYYPQPIIQEKNEQGQMQW